MPNLEITAGFDRYFFGWLILHPPQHERRRVLRALLQVESTRTTRHRRPPARAPLLAPIKKGRTGVHSTGTGAQLRASRVGLVATRARRVSGKDCIFVCVPFGRAPWQPPTATSQPTWHQTASGRFQKISFVAWLLLVPIQPRRSAHQRMVLRLASLGRAFGRACASRRALPRDI